MIRLPGGTFLMGTDDGEGFPEDGEGPVRKITLDPFLRLTLRDDERRVLRVRGGDGLRNRGRRFGWSFVFHLFISGKAKKKIRGRWTPPPGGRPSGAPTGGDLRDRVRASRPG